MRSNRSFPLRTAGLPQTRRHRKRTREGARTSGGRVVKILGVDPGVHGGLAIVEINDGTAPALLEAIDIPTAGSGSKERIDPLALRTWVMAHQPQHAFIERAQSMPKQGS